MSENTSLDLTGLNDYINQNSTELITKSAFSAMSTKLFKVQTGVKAETTINILNTSVTFDNGDECGLDEMSNQSITQRKITPGFMKVYLKYCQKDFYRTFASHLTNVAAGKETLPFEQYFIEDVIKEIGKELEKAIWCGDTESNNKNLNKFDGLLKIMMNEVKEDGAVNVGVPGADAKGRTMVPRIWAVYNAIPEEKLEDTVIYMSNANYRTLVEEIAESNMFHYERNVEAGYEMIFPGTSTTVKAVSGLNGQDVIVACDPRHVVYGTDLEGDYETFKFWFSDDDDAFKLLIEFAAGVQIALPNEVVLSYESASN